MGILPLHCPPLSIIDKGRSGGPVAAEGAQLTWTSATVAEIEGSRRIWRPSWQGGRTPQSACPLGLTLTSPQQSDCARRMVALQVGTLPRWRSCPLALALRIDLTCMMLASLGIIQGTSDGKD